MKCSSSASRRSSLCRTLKPPDATGGVVYVYVSDADAIHAEWTATRVESRFLGPHDTPYGLREFIYTDPDGIVHRVGSPL